jgi:hypothetical protein
MVIKVLIALTGIVLVLVVVVATRPSEFRVERTATMSAPAPVVFGQVNDFHKWGAWSPYAKREGSGSDGHAGDFSLEMLDEMNARHAKDFANCTRAETIELHRTGTAVAAATIRGLSDEELAKSGTLLKGVPPMTAEQVSVSGLLNHIDDHFGSIRKTVGH